jgi:hypothetical protein
MKKYKFVEDKELLKLVKSELKGTLISQYCGQFLGLNFEKST